MLRECDSETRVRVRMHPPTGCSKRIEPAQRHHRLPRSPTIENPHDILQVPPRSNAPPYWSFGPSLHFCVVTICFPRSHIMTVGRH